MAKNIFQLWKDNEEELPFGAHREGWTRERFTVVEGIRIRRWPYGVAHGYPTLNGEETDQYSSYEEWRDNREIPGAGTYQWTFVHLKQVDGRWVPDPDPPQRVFVRKSASVLTSESVLEFGKYKGQALSDILQRDPSYIEWMIENVASVVIDPESLLADGEGRRVEGISSSVAELNIAKFEKVAAASQDGD